MSTLEQPFQEAIQAKQIEGVILEGRNINGKRYSKVLGNRTLLDGTEKALSTSDIVFLASATKLLTTIAVLQCCDKGLLSLDEDLAPRLPEIVKLGVLVANEAGSAEAPATDKLHNPLTFRHILTHSSGLIYDFMAEPMQRWCKSNPIPKEAADVPSRYLMPLAFQPGESWSYGTGLDWAGYLVEQVTDTRLDEYFRKHILRPLGIAESEISFFPVKEGLGDRMPDRNPKDSNGDGLSPAMGQSVHGDVLTACFGGQGGYTSAEAYITVLESLLLNDGKLLKPATVLEMHKPQLEPGAKDALAALIQGHWGSFMSQNSTGPNRDYGLSGLLVGDEPEGGMGKRTLTWGGGCNSAWFVDPKNGVCGFASLQLGLPPDIKKAIELKGVFRNGINKLLEGME